MKKSLRTVLLLLLVIVAVLAFFAGPDLVDRGERVLYPMAYAQLIEREAHEFSLPPSLVYAVARTESHFDPEAESHAGAQGLMQLTPDTFDWVASLYPPENGGEDLMDPLDNIHCGCALLRLLLDQFGTLDVSLCAYNAGIGNVSNWLSEEKYTNDGENLHTIPYPETESYVKKVKAAMRKYQELYQIE